MNLGISICAYYDSAQQQIRTSIINKWVNVPANATIDTYPWYIDQIVVKNPWMTHLITPKTTIYSYSSTGTNLPPISWEYNWVAYWAGNFYWYTGSQSYKDYEGVCCCKIMPSTWIAWANLVAGTIDSSDRVGRTEVPNAWNIWKNSDSSLAKIFIFLNQYAQSSYPDDDRTYCFAWTRDTVNNSLTPHGETRGTQYDYNPSDYWYDLTWFTQVTGSSWIDSIVIDYPASNTVGFSFNIKDN